MKNQIILTIAILSLNLGFSQEKKDSIDFKIDTEKLLAELSTSSCKCIDSIETYNVSKDSVASKISACIDKKVVIYQMTKKLSAINNLDKTKEKQTLNIDINISKDSKEYKKHYFEIERYLMENCPAAKKKIAVTDEVTDNSLSKNSEAIRYYNLGLEATQKEDYQKSIDYYEKAVAVDHNFAFAYDNMGICYRRLNKFDNAIDAYEKSLKINPNGKMPLQNIAVVYEYKKEYKKAVNAYEKLAKVDKTNPEVFYGIGRIYTHFLIDYEKALENMCQAYNIYTNQKSPYRTDAEKVINVIHSEMEKQGKLDKFNEILKLHHIVSN